MNRTVVFGVKLSQRMAHAPEFQKVVSEHGCGIKTRIGLHHVEDGKCSASGVILLELIGDDAELQKLEAALKAIPGTEVQKMIFED